MRIFANFTSIIKLIFIFEAPPPAYPGLAHHPGSFHPPAYSPSFSRPPAYSATFSKKAYGSTFGSTGLRGNTYISNNYYGGPRTGFGGSPFLTSALFFNMGMRHNSYDRNSNAYNRSWTSDEDYRWRQTTKAPYFENKLPGSESFLPAAAVIGENAEG